MNKQAANFVGSIPHYYDRYLGPRIFQDFADDLAQRAAKQNPDAVLELAAGTGILTRRLRDLLLQDCALTSTDLNQPMLDVAKAKFLDNERVCFETADATSLPYDTSQFDTVVCQFGVMFFPDKPASYKEVLRTLKPGGRYIFNVWGAQAANPFAAIAHEVVTALFPENPPGFYKVPFGYHDERDIVESLREAGFSEVETKSLHITSEVGSAEDFAKGLVFGNPLFEEVTSRGGDPDAVCHAIAESIQQRLDTSMPLHAIVFTANKV
jgi:ubiquinone/menaquinone biosynthesis C-methylase UbiE